MQTLNLQIGVDIQASPDDGEELLRSRVDQVVEPLLAALAAVPSVRCGLHLSGTLLHWMGVKRAPVLQRLRDAVGEGRIEPIGGGYFDPILAAIPEHDVSGQLRLASNQLDRSVGRKPGGVWLVGRTWSSALTAQLHRAGYTYTLVDESNLLATGLDREQLEGHLVTERAGFSLALFPIHSDLQRRLVGLAADALRHRLRRHLVGRDERTVTLAFDGVEPGERLEALLTLIAVAGAENHWVKTATFSRALDRRTAGGRVYPPSISRSLGLDDSLEGLGWERFLVEYPEVNDLHKRMLMTSYRVQRMRMAAQRRTRGQASAVDGDRLRSLLERSCRSLWASQHHAAYWHGAHLGLYDAGRRMQAVGRLLQVERWVDEALGADPARARTRSLDFDCDGFPELMVRSGSLGAVIAPHRGGGLSSLDLLDRARSLGPVMRRHQEGYHVTSGQNEIQLVDDDEDSVNVVASLESTAELDSAMWFDLNPRLSFLDHFLGPETHLQSWQRGCYLEAGDFVTEPYQVMTEQEPTGEDEQVVQLGRSGTLEEAGKTSLVRVEKRFVFSRTLPRLRVEYRLVNRYFEPVRTHFGVEINLMLPGGIDGRATYSAVSGDDDLMGDLTVPRELTGVSYLELVDESCDLVVCCYIEEPADLWMMPVETVNRVAGGLGRNHQGVGLLIHRATDLWGSEEQSLNLRLEFTKI